MTLSHQDTELEQKEKENQVGKMEEASHAEQEEEEQHQEMMALLNQVTN